MNIDLEDATVVAYECASRFYKTSQENNWGELSHCRVVLAIQDSNFIASKMMEFLTTDNNCSYAVRAAALKSAVTVLEGVLSRSKVLGNKPEDAESAQYVSACQKDLNVHAICAHAQTIAAQMQALQEQTAKPSKKLKM